MLKIKIRFAGLCFIAVLLAPDSSLAQPANPQEILNSYISELQKNPNDNALREEIINHVKGMKQKPAIPEEARRHYVKAVTLLEDAKQPSDSADAAEEFRKALLIAPWWADTYMKMGLALETAQHYDEAIVAFKLFIVTNPKDEVLRKTQDEIYKIEAKAEKAAKDAEQARKDKAEMERRQQATRAEEDARAQQRKAEDLYRKCDGRRYVQDAGDSDNTADLRGKQVVMGSVYKSGADPNFVPSNMRIGVWKDLWDLRVSKMEMDRGRLVLDFDGSNNNWMYEKAYLNDDCEIKFKFKSGDESGYYLPRNR